MVAAGLNLILNYILIPKHQALGAVIATVISYMTLFLLHATAGSKAGNACFDMRKMSLSILSMILFGFLFSTVKDTFVARYMLFVLFSVLVYLRKGKNIIREIWLFAEK
jgi:O-antigen/teichoic acid export membrane protein